MLLLLEQLLKDLIVLLIAWVLCISASLVSRLACIPSGSTVVGRACIRSEALSMNSCSVRSFLGIWDRSGDKKTVQRRKSAADHFLSMIWAARGLS